MGYLPLEGERIFGFKRETLSQIEIEEACPTTGSLSLLSGYPGWSSAPWNQRHCSGGTFELGFKFPVIKSFSGTQILRISQYTSVACLVTQEQAKALSEKPSRQCQVDTCGLREWALPPWSLTPTGISCVNSHLGFFVYSFPTFVAVSAMVICQYCVSLLALVFLHFHGWMFIRCTCWPVGLMFACSVTLRTDLCNLITMESWRQSHHLYCIYMNIRYYLFLFLTNNFEKGYRFGRNKMWSKYIHIKYQ